MADFARQLEAEHLGKALVRSLYEFLTGPASEQPLREADVHRAIEGRCEEATLEVDLTQLLGLVCPHARDEGDVGVGEDEDWDDAASLDSSPELYKLDL